MKFKLFSMVLALCFGAVALTADAAPKYQSKKAAKAADQKSAEKKPGCCAKKAQTAVAKDEVKAAKKGCCAKKAQTVAAGEKAAGEKGCCAKKAQTAVAKDEVKAAKKGCCAKKAQTVAAGEKAAGEKGCCAKKGAKTAKTVASGGCSKKCGKSHLTVVSEDGKTKKCGLTGKTMAVGDCPIEQKTEAVLAEMPAIKYQVGDQSMCCPKAAKYHAEKTKSEVFYMVGEEKFKDEGTATAKLASLMDEELSSMKTVQFSVDGKCSRCPMTAKSMAKKSGGKMMYRVAGWDFADQTQAEKAAKLAAEAADKVAMTYKVGDQSFNCSKSAGTSTKEGDKMVYVVSGEETCCETQAKVLLAQARVRAMVEAAASLVSM